MDEMLNAKEFDFAILSECHITDVAELERICFSSPISEANIKSILVDGIGKGFVCVERQSGKVAAYGGVMVAADEAQILNIATHPDRRGKGLARCALNNILDYSKNNGASFITLEVRESNSVAIGLYTSSGFYEVGRLKNYYKHPTEDALILKREIIS